MVGGLYMVYLAIFCGFLGFQWTKHIQMLKTACSIYLPGLVKTVTDIEKKFGNCCSGFSIYQSKVVTHEFAWLFTCMASGTRQRCKCGKQIRCFVGLGQYRLLLYVKLWWYRICEFEVTPQVTCISTTGYLRASLWLTGCVIQYTLTTCTQPGCFLWNLSQISFIR